MNDDQFRELFSSAITYQGQKNYPAAMEQLNRVLLERPDFYPAWNNRAALLQALGHPFDAIMNYDRAIALKPDAAEYYNNRGASYMSLELFDKALEDFDLATARNRRFPQVQNNRGNVYLRLNDMPKAIECYRSAIQTGPKYVDSHLGLSFALLKSGQFEEGWKEFEWRWESEQLVKRGLNLLTWEGGRARDERDGLVIYSEQGLGDTLQFMRYCKLAKAAWRGRVYIEVAPPLSRVVRSLEGVDGVIVIGEPMPLDVTMSIAMMSLPRVLGTTLETIPGECPYIKADPYCQGLWAERIKLMPPGFFVGVCWAGANRMNNEIASAVDKRRSLSLQQLAPLAQVPGVSWISLQKGNAAPQVKAPPAGMTIGDFTDDMYDMYDTAAMITQLDLVITVDTSVAHLAGALGKPTWVLSRFDSCWRWLDNRETSPWYPTMRLFYQEGPLAGWDNLLKDHLVPELKRAVVNYRQKLAA